MELNYWLGKGSRAALLFTRFCFRDTPHQYFPKGAIPLTSKGHPSYLDSAQLQLGNISFASHCTYYIHAAVNASVLCCLPATAHDGSYLSISRPSCVVHPHHPSEVLLAAFLPLKLLQHRLALGMEFVQPRQLLQKVRFVERAQQHRETFLLVRVDDLFPRGQRHLPHPNS